MFCLVNELISCGESLNISIWIYYTTLQCLGMKMGGSKSQYLVRSIQEFELEKLQFLGILSYQIPWALFFFFFDFDRMRKKLEGWKGKLLVLGGRIILLNSIVWLTPLYFVLFVSSDTGLGIDWIEFVADFYRIILLMAHTSTT